jgi:hypothetical protein
MNLYGDESLCASESYLIEADTFDQNLNCSYLWSTGATSGKLTVYDSDEYSVTVTSLCGETASDSKVVEFYPLPPADAGVDTFMCYGDTIQLNATGGVLFSWSPGGTLTDPGIQNPRAFPSVTTRYYVNVTDTNECSSSDYVDVTVYPIPTSTFSAPAFVCGTAEAAISYTGSASGDASYMWDFDGGTDTPVGVTHNVSWAEIGLKTVSLVVEENTCVSDTTRHDISVNPVPISDFSMPSGVCGIDQVNVVYSGTDSVGADYDWTFDGGTAVGSDEGPYLVSWGNEGTKYVSLEVTQDGCISPVTQKQVVVAYPYEDAEICIVTVDSLTGKNMVVWEKTPDAGIASYNIWREGSTVNDSVLVQNVDINSDAVVVDAGSEPESKAHRYWITAVDTCGNESGRSMVHKTMLLTTSLGPTAINLNWLEYEVEGQKYLFVGYKIFRSASTSSFSLIDSIASGSPLYPDDDPLDGTNYYRIAGLLESPCQDEGGKKAGTGPYNHSLSNLDDNKLKETAVRDLLSGDNSLRVYPNPFQDEVSVDYLLQQASDVKIEVFNILGVRVLELENTWQAPGIYHYNIRAADLDGSSLYYLRFSVGDKIKVRKLVPSR